MPTLSTMVTSYDQPEICAMHIREIYKSTRLPDEIIVVNDGGPDSLKKLLMEVKQPGPKLIYAKIKKDIPWNYTGARNLAFWLSTGDYIAMEDTDHIPFPNVYEKAIDFMEDKKNRNIDMLIFHTRHKVYKKDALANPIEKWTVIPPPRGTHYDTQIMRRLAYAKIKGCDERFAGEYAWANTDWRRRIERAKIKKEKLYVNYWVILDGETETLVRARSKRNYRIAQQKAGEERIMSPAGIMNFEYTYEQI